MHSLYFLFSVVDFLCIPINIPNDASCNLFCHLFFPMKSFTSKNVISWLDEWINFILFDSFYLMPSSYFTLLYLIYFLFDSFLCVKMDWIWLHETIKHSNFGVQTFSFDIIHSFIHSIDVVAGDGVSGDGVSGDGAVKLMYHHSHCIKHVQQQHYTERCDGMKWILNSPNINQCLFKITFLFHSQSGMLLNAFVFSKKTFFQFIVFVVSIFCIKFLAKNCNWIYWKLLFIFMEIEFNLNFYSIYYHL